MDQTKLIIVAKTITQQIFDIMDPQIKDNYIIYTNKQYDGIVSSVQIVKNDERDTDLVHISLTTGNYIIIQVNICYLPRMNSKDIENVDKFVNKISNIVSNLHFQLGVDHMDEVTYYPIKSKNLTWVDDVFKILIDRNELNLNDPDISVELF